MSDDLQQGVVLTFAAEGVETIVAAAETQDTLTASVQAFADTATSAYAQATAAQRSIIDAFMQQAAAARESGASVANQKAQITQAIAELDAYALAWSQGAAASIAGSTAAAQAAGTLRIQIAELTAAQQAQTAAAKEAAAAAAASARLSGADSALAGYMAQADAIVTSNAALGVQQVELQAIAAQLKQDVAAFTLLGDAGVAAADASAEALTLVQAALASIRAEQAAVIAGMAGMAEAAVVAGDAEAMAAGKAAAGMAGLSSGFVAMAASMAPIAAAIGLAVLTKDATEYAVSLERLHQRLGISTEDLSAFHVAAKINGMDVEDMNRAFVMLAKNIDLALHDKTTQLTNFGEVLHMTSDEVKAWGQGGDFKSHFLDVVNALDQIPDAETRLAKAAELLSRAGGGGGQSGAANLLNTLHSLAGDGFAKATEEAQRLGVVVDEQTGQKALEWQQGWEKIKLSLEGIGLSISKSLLPALNQLGAALDGLSAWDPKGSSFANITQFMLGKGFGNFAANPSLTTFNQATSGAVNPIFDAITQGSAPLINATQSTLANVGWISQQTPWMPTTNAAPSTIFNNPKYNRPGSSDTGDAELQKQLLTTAQEQLDIATKKAQIASTTDESTKLLLTHQLAILEITKQQTAEDAKVNKNDKIDDATKALLIASDALKAKQDTIAADAKYSQQLKDSADKQREMLAIAVSQLDIETQKAAVANAKNIVDANLQAYELKLLEILKAQTDEDKKIDDNKKLDDATKLQLKNLEELKTRKDIGAAADAYDKTVSDTAQAEEKHLDTLNKALAVQQYQLGVSGNTSALLREQLKFTEEQAAIEDERQKALSSIPTGNKAPSNADAQIALINQTADAKKLASLLNEEAALDRINAANATTLIETNLIIAARERGVQIANNDLTLALLNQNAVKTTQDVWQAASIERQNAMLQEADKRAQIDETERKAIQDQTLFIVSQIGKVMNQIPVDPAAITQAFALMKAASETAAADRITLEKQTQVTILGIQFKSIQDANAALAEARYNNSIMQMTEAQHQAQALADATGSAMDQAFANSLKALLDGMKTTADRVNEIWQSVGDEAAKSFGTLFQTLSRGGGFDAAFKAMGQSFEANFGNIIEKQIKVWTDELTKLATGQPLIVNGKVQTDSQGNVIMSKDAQPGAQLAIGGLAIGEAGLAGYSAGSGHGQATTTALAAGLSAGIATGNVYIGIAAAVASLIGSALSTAAKQSEYLYGVAQITNGQATITGRPGQSEQNINAQKQAELVSQLQDSFNTAWNGFVGVMGKLGGQAPAMPASVTGEFQPNPSAYWETHFQQYLTDTLPTEIAALFKNGMEKSFVSNGLTSDAFNKFWDEAANLDPTKRVQFWTDLANGITSFADAQQKYQAVVNMASYGDFSGAKYDSSGNALLTQDNDFISALKTGAKQVYSIAQNMVALTGPDRIAAFAQMGASVDQIAVAFTQFINQVSASLKAVGEDFANAYLQHNLTAIQNDPTLSAADKANAQARLLEQSYNQVMYQIQHASESGLNPQDIQALEQQGIGLLNQIYSLDPSAAADQWWQQQMPILQKASTDAINLMGTAATTEMGKFLDSIAPFKDYMLGLPVTIDPAIVALEGEFTGLAAAIAALTVSITDATPPPSTGGGSGGPGTGKGGGNGGNDGNNTGNSTNTNSIGTPVVVQVNGGTFVSTDDFIAAVVDGVALAMRENPQKFAPLFGAG